MNYAVDSIIIVATILGLWWGAVWIVEAASRIAKRLGVSELIIGLTVVAMGTSAPEFAVTVGAALKGQGAISIGNVVGSNIFNLGFILGGVALVRAITTTRSLVYRDGIVMIGITFLLLFFLRDLTMERWEGGILFALLFVYIGYLIYTREPMGADDIPEGDFQWLDIPRLLIGLALVVTSGHYLVESASNLARAFGVTEWVIGVTIVAAGTSAPELVTSLIAVLRGRYGISAGNLIGSDIFNLLGVLGLAALLQPMGISDAAYSSLYVLSGMVILVVIMMRTGWKISRWEGGLLILINIIRWWMDFQR
ncbi:MAG: calcium/sodium antiporter [Anaerolineales bacterium]|jgi:cation:H+ antiporter|nr:calcium/sodium antiporter [Anaerolineales bacterium]